MRLSTPKAAFLLAISSLWAWGLSDVAAQGRPQASDGDTLHTVAGEIRIVELERNCRYEVTINGKRLIATDCGDEQDPNAGAPRPEILVYSRLPAKPFSQVVIFQQQMAGNACDGGPLWLLGLRTDGPASRSTNIDFCGGAQPSITVEQDRIVISIPGGPRNRGEGVVPGEDWLYQNDELTRLKHKRGPGLPGTSPLQ
jgi:hypothetical protein